MLTLNDLVDNFQTIGLQSGDTLLVHSSYKSFGGVEGAHKPLSMPSCKYWVMMAL